MRVRLLFLLLAAATLVTAWKFTAAEQAALPPAVYQPMEPVIIAVAADLHYLSPVLMDHGAAFRRVTENADGKVTEILTSSLEVSPNQYGVLTVGEHEVDYRTVPVDVSAWAAAQGRDEASLLHFENYADAVFYSTACAQVNAAYFAGRMDRAPQNPDLLKKWHKQNSFLAAYLQSMTADFGSNFTRYHSTGGIP